MTRMLASVQTLDEAELVLRAGVDIIDLKQPASGALGALPAADVACIVKAVNRRRSVSATIGDLPMQPEPILEAAQAMAETGVDYIKIGFFQGDPLGALVRLAEWRNRLPPLIAVLFADAPLDFTVIDELQAAGFKGVMLDTADKAKGALPELLTEETLSEFVKTAKAKKLLCGLAGSLQVEHVPALLRLNPDYLGFRSALCKGRKRINAVDREKLLEVKKLLIPN